MNYPIIFKNKIKLKLVIYTISLNTLLLINNNKLNKIKKIYKN